MVPKWFNFGHGAFGQFADQMILSHHQGYVFGHSVVSLDLENVLQQMRFGVQSLPGDGAGIERIVLERNESQVRDAAVRFQLIDEAAPLRNAPLRIWPDANVFVDSFEHRPNCLAFS